MTAGFSHHAAERGQPRKCVLQSLEYPRRGRNGSALAPEAPHNMSIALEMKSQINPMAWLWPPLPREARGEASIIFNLVRCSIHSSSVVADR